MVGLVIKSLIAGSDAVGEQGDSVIGDLTGGEPLCRYGVARFTPVSTEPAVGAKPTDEISAYLLDALAKVPETSAVRIEQFFSPNPDAADPFQAMREAQLGVLNMGHRMDADAVFWGRQNANTGQLDLHFVSDALTSSPYDLMLPLTFSFKQPTHPDAFEAMRILLCAELVSKSLGGEQRGLQIARLSSMLEDMQDRINGGETFADVGNGVAVAYGFGAFMLTETGDRSYCASALRVLEPYIRQVLSDAGDTAKGAQADPNIQELRTEDLLNRITDFSKLRPFAIAALTLYGGLVNWSLIANLKARSGSLAVGIWRLLERRIELSVGTPVDRALAICKLAEAMVSTGKDAENAKIVDKGAAHYRRALGMINTRAHGPLYALTAYGLAEAIVSSSTINDVTVPDTQVVPVFQAALKVCGRRQQPYIWGRVMFALATVYLTNGNLHKDSEMLTNARMSYSQAYDAFMDAGAKGAARAASGGYTRSDNMLSQLGHRKSIMDATGGTDDSKAAAS
jgi:hypothetical protein